MSLVAVYASLSILSGLASSFALPNSQLQPRDDACSSGPWIGPQAIGGSDTGSPWCETKWNEGGSHEIISVIQVWAAEGNGVNGVQFQYSAEDMPSDVHGKDEDDGDADNCGTLTLEPGEKIIKASLWGDGSGTRLGKIYLETSNDQKLDVGWEANADEYEIDVGSGILIGAYGAESDSVDRLAWLFLASEIVSIEVTNVDYPDLPTIGDANIEPLALLDTTMGNDKNNAGNITVMGSVSQAETETSSWTQSITNTFGIELKLQFSAKFLGMGEESDITTKWEVSKEESTTHESTEQVTLSNQVSALVMPGDGVHCTITTFKGEGDFDYTSTVNIELKDGTIISYPQKGTLKTTQYGKAQGKCEPANDLDEWDGTQDSPPNGMKVMQ